MADATLTTSTAALLAAFDQHQLTDDDDTRLDGDRDAVRRLITGVTVPTPTPVGTTTPNEHNDQPTVTQ